VGVCINKSMGMGMGMGMCMVQSSTKLMPIYGFTTAYICVSHTVVITSNHVTLLAFS
jgi:hypothetical protein